MVRRRRMMTAFVEHVEEYIQSYIGSVFRYMSIVVSDEITEL